MATNINLTSKTLRTARPHAVYLKQKWTDDWTRIPYLWAEEVAWRLAPSLSTATLVWEYGVGLRQGEFALKTVARLTNVRRLYVKILIGGHALTGSEGDPADLAWYGTIEMDGFHSEGLLKTGQSNGQSVYTLSGKQPLVCLGLEHALYRHPIRGATWLDSDGGEKRSGTPFVFNRESSVGAPSGNRSNQLGFQGTFVFAPNVGHNDAALWRSRTIAAYLCAHERPAGFGAFDLALDPDTEQVLPDWDTPVIDPAGHSTAELLNLLMPKSRMLSWHLTVLPEDDFEAVFLTPVSLLGSDITTDLGTLFGNQQQVTLNDSTAADLAPDNRYAIKDSDIGIIDQARVRGARRTSTCTLSAADGSLVIGWPLAREAEYEAGYSGADDYAELPRNEQQAANAEVRHTDRLFAVFRRFAIPDLWDQIAFDGLGEGPAHPVFLENDAFLASYHRVCPRELELATTLPLVDGFDYRSIAFVEYVPGQGDTITGRTPPEQIAAGPHNRIPAFVLFLTPDWQGEHEGEPTDAPYVQVEKIGTGSALEQTTLNRDRHWSARVEIPRQDRAVLLHVTGEPQHVLAFSEMIRLPVDPFLGRWDWRDALFTVCLLDDRHAEGVYPDDFTAFERAPGGVRELVIEAGDQYKQDFLVPGTVVGLDLETRQPVRCAAGGWINDDVPVLQARAQQVFEYYGQTRRSLQLTTPIVTSQLAIGQYIVNFGSAHSVRSLGTVISEIVVTIPGGDSAELPPPTMQVTTAFAELETLELLNRRPEDKQLRGRPAALMAARP